MVDRLESGSSIWCMSKHTVILPITKFSDSNPLQTIRRYLLFIFDCCKSFWNLHVIFSFTSILIKGSPIQTLYFFDFHRSLLYPSDSFFHLVYILGLLNICRSHVRFDVYEDKSIFVISLPLRSLCVSSRLVPSHSQVRERPISKEVERRQTGT